MKLGSYALAAALQGALVAARSDDAPRNGQPQEVRSVEGLLEVTLSVGMVTTDVRVGPGYNGAGVGPTLRAKPGDTVRIKLVNNLDPSDPADLEKSSFALTPVVDDKENEVKQTLLINRLHPPEGNAHQLPREEYWGHSFQNLHFHGCMVDPAVDDSRVYIDGGGQDMTYEFEIPDDAPPLFGWYHNHVHGTATYSALSGLYGAFFIEGKEKGSVPEATEQVLLLSETRNYDDNTPKDYISIAMDFDWDHVTNGQKNPTMTFKKGENVRFRVVNAGVEPAMDLSIDDHELTLFAMDGYPVPASKAVPAKSIYLDAGVRADFFVKFDTPGEFRFKRAPWNVGVTGEVCMVLFKFLEEYVDHCISYDKETDVGLIVVTEDDASTPVLDISDALEAQPAKRSSMPKMHPYLRDLLSMPISGKKTITFDQTETLPIFQIPYDGEFVPPGVGMGVNNLLFNPHTMHGEIKAGTCEEWTVVHTAPGPPIHSFHAHYAPFYVTHMDGVELEESERFWRDTMVTGLNFTATFCFPSRDTPSYINVHCHMPHHQDIGMAAHYSLLPDLEKEKEKEKVDEKEASAQSLKASTLVLGIIWGLLIFL